MRVAVIENGHVANVIEVDDLATAFKVQRLKEVPEGEEPADPPELMWFVPEGITIPDMVASDTAQIGDLLVAGAFVRPPPVPVPVVVPRSLTPLQTRRVLNAHGLRAQVESAIAAAGTEAKDAWEFANAIQRDDPLVLQLTTLLGLTALQVDALFIEGATL